MYTYKVMLNGLMCEKCDERVIKAVSKKNSATKVHIAEHKELTFLSPEVIEEEAMKQMIEEIGYSQIAFERNEKQSVFKKLFG